MNARAHQARLLVGFVAAAGLVLAILFGLARLALGGLRSAAALPLAGSLDPSFGTDGVVTHSPGPGRGIGGIVVQPDRKIVAVAFGSLVRYLPDGSLDSSFGNGGYVATGFEADALALQPDGKIVVAGSSGPVSDGINSEFAVARYNPTGALDTSFGTNGITKTIIPEPPSPCGGVSGAEATVLAVLSGGDILAAGSAWWDDCDTLPASSFALVRYTSDGSLDPTFGDAGIVQTSFVAQDYLSGIAVQPDGKIVASGSAGYGGHGGIDIASMALARYEPDGALDPTFGTGGEVTTNHKLLYDGGPPTLQRGKIFVAGSTLENNGAIGFSVLARFEASGRLDSTFGKRGIAKIGSDTGGPTAVAAQNDGKILIATAYSSVVRLLPNGRPDTHFGRRGFVTLPYWLGFSGPTALALQGDGKVLVGGRGGNAWMLARLIGGNNCVVPRLHGKTISKASASLKKSYCRRGRTTRRYTSEVTRGRVISTAPPRGTRLPDGTKVDLVVSKGKRP